MYTHTGDTQTRPCVKHTCVLEKLQSKDEALLCLLFITQLIAGKRQVTEAACLVTTATQGACRHTHLLGVESSPVLQFVT